jgi:hypothetical protein
MAGPLAILKRIGVETNKGRKKRGEEENEK